MKSFRQLLSIALTLCVSMAVSTAVHARDIRGVTVEWSPHYGSSLEEQGALTAITREAFRRSGHNFTIEFIPWERALKEASEGNADMVMGAYFSEDRAQTFAYSQRIYNIDVGLVALKSLGVNRFDSLDDLTDYTIGVGRGYVNSTEFDSADFLNKETAAGAIQNIHKLFRNRVDLIAAAFDIVGHELKQEGFCAPDVVYLEPPLTSNGLFNVFPKVLPDHEQIVADFNAGLQSMRDDGSFDRLLRRLLR